MNVDQPYVRNAWYMAGWLKDFPVGEPRALSLLDEPVVFFRGADGKLAALEDRCCHRLAPLSQGRVEGNDLRCLYHGLKFAADGICIEMPGHTSIPKAMRVRSYPLIERYSAAFIWMGDPAMADESLLPPFIGYESPDWCMLPGRMDYDVQYELIQDNLLDLSHLAWVHRNSFGQGNPDFARAWAEAELTVSALSQGVRVQRWITNGRTPPQHQGSVGASCHSLNTFDYLLPGYLLLTTSYYSSDTELVGANRSPSNEPFFKSFTAQAVTPLTRRKTSYFFCFGPWSKDPVAESLKQPFLDLAYLAFNEDKDMLTGQQRIIDADPARGFKLFDVDKAPVMYRRMVEKLLAERA
jgi:phenylpropionate dioxygenase-like ring-hydroxylating dioxygenase large terminal subunit